MKVQCLVIVNGYTENKFDSKRGRFVHTLAVLPAVGDTLMLEPGPTWGQIWCVVEHRKIDGVGVVLYTRLMTDEDRAKLCMLGEHFQYDATCPVQS